MCSLNTGGPPGIFRLLKLIETKELEADVVCIQESRLYKAELEVVERRWAALGYYVYYQAGGCYRSRENEMPMGGVMIAVKKVLKQDQIYTSKAERTQVLAIRTQGWQIANFYSPPGASEELEQEILKSEHAMGMKDFKLYVGDWNQEPDGEAAMILSHQEVTPVELEEDNNWSTRFAGKYRLDWFATNQRTKVMRTNHLDVKISDHKIITTVVGTPKGQPQKRNSLVTGPSWKKPAIYRKKEWMDILTSCWERLQKEGKVPWIQRADVEEEWKDFMNHIDMLYRQAHTEAVVDIEEKLCETSLMDDEREQLAAQLKDIKHKLRNRKVKGIETQFRTQMESGETKTQSERTMAWMKHRKAIGRIQNIEGLIRKHGLKEALDLQEVRNIQAKLKLKIDWTKSKEGVLEALTQARNRKNRLVEDADRVEKQAKINAWREKVMGSVKEASAWLKTKQYVTTKLVAGTATREEVCDQIKGFWRKEWDVDEKVRNTRNERIQKAMIEPLQRFLKGKRLPKLTEEDLKQGMRKAMAKARGAGGTDGYHGDEIACLPIKVADRFYQVSKRWRRTGQVPEGMKEIVQASMQKPKKPAAIQNLRPLSIFSCWWRTFEASTMKTKWYAQWKEVIGLDDVAYKESAEEVAANVIMLFRNQGYLAALDYSKAYDHMAPETTIKLLRETGVDEELLGVLEMVWRHQVRYVSFDGHFSLEPLHTEEAHPQGGPWGPPVMQVWMIVGVIATKEMEGKKGEEKRGHRAQQEGPQESTNKETDIGPPGKRRRKESSTEGGRPKKRGRETGNEETERNAKRYKVSTKAYMDDRNIVTNNAEALLDGIEAWQEWSKTVELQENAAKTQIIAKGEKERKLLKTAIEARPETDWSKFTVTVAEVLGASVGGGATLAPKEQERIEKTRMRIAILDSAQLPKSMSMVYKKCLALSVCSYGWLSRVPNMQTMTKLSNEMYGRAFTRLATNLKQVLLGGGYHPWPVTVVRLTGITIKAVAKMTPEFSWTEQPQTPVQLLKAQLKKLGWKATDQWQWHHEELDKTMDLRVKVDKKEKETETQAWARTLKAKKGETAHLVRESFRNLYWRRHWASKRHEAMAIRQENPEVIKYPSKRYEATKKVMWMDDVYPKILGGGVVSPAAMREQKTEKEVPTCCIACGELGTFDHVFWECQHVHKLLGGRPVVTDPIQRRYGWPKGENKEEDLEVLEWMKKVTQTIWDQRYSDAAKQEAKEKMIRETVERHKERHQRDVIEDEEGGGLEEEEEGEEGGDFFDLEP